VDGTIFTRCGPEIGVAATKTFTSQLVAIILLAIRLGRARGHLTPDQARKMLIELTKLPGLVQRVLEKREEIKKSPRSSLERAVTSSSAGTTSILSLWKAL